MRCTVKHIAPMSAYIHSIAADMTRLIHRISERAQLSYTELSYLPALVEAVTRLREVEVNEGRTGGAISNICSKNAHAAGVEANICSTNRHRYSIKVRAERMRNKKIKNF